MRWKARGACVLAVTLAGVVVLAYEGAAAKILVRPAAASQTVVVPRVVGGVVGAYARLRAAGLRVSIPRGMRFDSLRPPVVARSVPAAGKRVARDSVVRLYLSCCARARNLQAPIGRLRGFVVPKFAGGTVSAASGWAAKHKLDFRASLGPLNAGAEGGLWANYRVSGQRPAAGVRIVVGKRTRAANGNPGRFQRTTLSVWGAQPPPCTPPAGSAVVDSSAAAVITSHVFKDSYADGPLFAWYGCLRTVGEWRFLAGSETGAYSGVLEVQQVRLAGRFVAFSFLDTYSKNTGCEYDVGIYDLSTGKPGKVFSPDCSADFARPDRIDSLSVDPNGFAAWHMSDGFPLPGLTGMSCPSVALCVATDRVGNVLTTTNPTGGRQAWSIATIASGALQGVSCPTASLCVAVGANGIYTSTDPTGGAAAWTVTQTNTPPLDAVACPSANLCVAGGSPNVITSSTNPTGGSAAWITTEIPGFGRIHAIGCASTALCVVGGGPSGPGGTIATSTDPAGGTSAWTATTNPITADVQGVSCPSTNLCVAVSAIGYVLTSTDPTAGAHAWSVAQLPEGPEQRISCPSANLCVAGSGSTSTNPAGGASTWIATRIPIRSQVQAISCPSATLCVAGDSEGHILTSTNPAGGGTAWSATLIDAPPSCNNTPCWVEHVDAHDTQGTHVLDTSLPGGGNAITSIHLSGNQLTWSDSGAQHQATLH